MANKKYEHIDINYIIDQYVNHNRPSTELALELNVSDWWIRDRLNKKNIPIRRQGGGLNTIDLTGQKFGNYTVLEKIERPGIDQCARWKVRCDCGNENEVYSKALRNGEATSCGLCGPRPVKWNGIGELSGSILCGIRKSAKDRNIDFNVSKEYLWELFLLQNRRCNLSGLELTFGTKIGNRIEDKTASLDRIDSNKGYLEGNVQWVHKNINLIKWSFSQEYFINLCEQIVEHNKSKHERYT